MMNDKYEGFPLWYRELQHKAEEKQKEMGWPDGREEAWRRTELKRLELEDLYLTPPASPSLERRSPMNLQSPSPESSHLSLSYLMDAVRGDYPGVRELYEAQFAAGDNRFIFRLLSEPPRGFYLYLPRNYTAENLIFLEDNLMGTENESFTMNLIVLEEGARTDVWERIGTSEISPLHNRATLILLNKGAKLNYYRTQTLMSESSLVDFSRALLKGDSELKFCQAEKDIYFNKSHITADLQEPRSRAELRGIYHIGGRQFNEIFTEQIHRTPYCQSRAFYRGVLEDQARTVYNGMIRVLPEAVKTDAYLTNNNLLLNDGCRADSIPGLKIATNDVKCSHGSTTGKVDPRQLFYLESRGFSSEEARTILTRAFLEEVLGEMPVLVREELENRWDWAREDIYV